jgi:hypothetical protein
MKKALILNGFAAEDAGGAKLREALMAELGSDKWSNREFVLRDEKIAYCIGCSGCWLKTPGECLVDDAGREVAKALVQSDLVIFLTPVTFGGYSSDLKKALDRIIPIISPFFAKVNGETHHEKRYDRYPKMLALGLLPEADDAATTIFKTIHARNAINAYAPAAASATVVAGTASDALEKSVRSLFSQIGENQ